jgi:hypothetical protein
VDLDKTAVDELLASVHRSLGHIRALTVQHRAVVLVHVQGLLKAKQQPFEALDVEH